MLFIKNSWAKIINSESKKFEDAKTEGKLLTTSLADESCCKISDAKRNLTEEEREKIQNKKFLLGHS